MANRHENVFGHMRFRLRFALRGLLGIQLAPPLLFAHFLALVPPAAGVTHLRLEMVPAAALVLLSSMHFTHGKSPIRSLIGKIFISNNHKYHIHSSKNDKHGQIISRLLF